MPGSVLIVDDEDAVRFFASYGLTRAGWQVYEAESGEAALAFLEEETRCDVMFLDLRMTGIDGVSVMRQVKERWPEIIVIIMTAYASVDSAIEAVRQGAFDYLQKPCSVEDILACAERAAVESAKAKQPQPLDGVNALVTVQTGALIINRGAHTVSLNGQPVSLTPTEFELLALLAEQPGQPVSLERLIKEGLGYNANDTHVQETLRVHISRMRRKIGYRYIVTVRGGGYALAQLPLP